MLKYYIKTTEALKSLRDDKRGVVSFEYIIVACAIIAVVGVAFSKTGPLNDALVAGIAKIGTTLTAALP
jgi:pilus assembly protein Flp/PilA